MKTKFQLIDLAICAICILSIFSRRAVWNETGVLSLILAMFVRIVVSFSLAYKEKRTWIPLLVFAACCVMSYMKHTTPGSFNICFNVLELTGIHYDIYIDRIVLIFTNLWVSVLPFIYYLVLLCRRKLIRTEFVTKDLLGAVLWKDRNAKYYMAFIVLTLFALLIGLSMSGRLCKLACLVLVPLGFWLFGKYQNLKARRIWLMIVAMFLFWYAQPFGGCLRAAMLTLSLCLVAYDCIKLLHETRKYLLTGFCILYFGVLLPSFSIGYNQYACINYPRLGFGHLPFYEGILFISDLDDNEKIGLRDRYGLLVEPEYEHIEPGFCERLNFCSSFSLYKDCYTLIYDIYENKILPSERDAQLQRDLCNVLKDYFSQQEKDTFNDCGEIMVTDLKNSIVVGQARVVMYGNPYFKYTSFLPNDTAEVIPGTYCRMDSTLVHISSGYKFHKNILSYSENLPNDSCAQYNVYIRLAQDKLSKEKDIKGIMSKIKESTFFK